MNYINKYLNLTLGHGITDTYLESICKIKDGKNYWYQNVDYDGNFRTSGAKDKMINLSLTSQNSLCCYCKRRLEKDTHITLEHIIPQKISDEQFSVYLAFQIPLLSADRIIKTSNFTGVINISLPPRPHTVTYENLIVSCNGTFPDKGTTTQCCNNYRSNSLIYPIFYLKDVEDFIQYGLDGSIIPVISKWNPDIFIKTIQNLGLNCMNLKDVRRLWSLLKDCPLDEIQKCLNNKDLRSKILLNNLFKDNNLLQQDIRIFIKYMKDEYWKTFLQYDWFYNKFASLKP